MTLLSKTLKIELARKFASPGNEAAVWRVVVASRFQRKLGRSSSCQVQAGEVRLVQVLLSTNPWKICTGEILKL